MRMPSRPFYPMALPPDIFGLERPSLLGQACESEAETQKRIATVEKSVAAAFEAAVEHLGDAEARQLFARVVRRTKRGPGTCFAPDRDTRLLEELDAAAQTGESVAAIAKRLRAEGTRLGATEGAIATQIRKLRNERTARERAAAVQARRWRMATRREAPGLLSEDETEK